MKLKYLITLTVIGSCLALIACKDKRKEEPQQEKAFVNPKHDEAIMKKKEQLEKEKELEKIRKEAQELKKKKEEIEKKIKEKKEAIQKAKDEEQKKKLQEERKKLEEEKKRLKEEEQRRIEEAKKKEAERKEREERERKEREEKLKKEREKAIEEARKKAIEEEKKRREEELAHTMSFNSQACEPWATAQVFKSYDLAKMFNIHKDWAKLHFYTQTKTNQDFCLSVTNFVEQINESDKQSAFNLFDSNNKRVHLVLKDSPFKINEMKHFAFALSGDRDGKLVHYKHTNDQLSIASLEQSFSSCSINRELPIMTTRSDDRESFPLISRGAFLIPVLEISSDLFKPLILPKKNQLEIELTLRQVQVSSSSLAFSGAFNLAEYDKQGKPIFIKGKSYQYLNDRTYNFSVPEKRLKLNQHKGIYAHQRLIDEIRISYAQKTVNFDFLNAYAGAKDKHESLRLLNNTLSQSPLKQVIDLLTKWHKRSIKVLIDQARKQQTKEVKKLEGYINWLKHTEQLVDQALKQSSKTREVFLPQAKSLIQSFPINDRSLAQVRRIYLPLWCMPLSKKGDTEIFFSFDIKSNSSELNREKLYTKLVIKGDLYPFSEKQAYTFKQAITLSDINPNL